MTFALCRTCRRALLSYEVEPLLGGEPKVYWAHYAYLSPSQRHDAVPLPSVRVRALLCTSCHQPQTDDGHGWHCATCDHT